ncbi:MAG: GNAT family N-acetyltransferase, partial [Clostridia bacterium]
LTLITPVGLVTSEQFVKAINNKQTLQFLYPKSVEYAIDRAETFLSYVERAQSDKTKLMLGIFIKTSGEFIGMVSLENIDYISESCYVGYWIRQEDCGKGYAIEATKAICDYAFCTLRVQKINADVDLSNTRSVNLLEKLGFVRLLEKHNTLQNSGFVLNTFEVSKEMWFFLYQTTN